MADWRGRVLDDTASDDTLLCAEPTTSGPVIASMPECARPCPAREGATLNRSRSCGSVAIAGGAFWVMVRREI